MEQELLDEILVPDKSALVAWDVQNMLVNRIFNKQEFLQNTKQLISTARQHDIPVFFSKITPLPRRFESPVRKLFIKRMGGLNYSPDGLDLAIQPEEHDTVIPKHTASFFVGTHFEQMLRNARISTIVLTGIATEIGVESTARDASNRGFFPVIATDAVSSRSEEAHERSLQNMEKMFILQSSQEIAGVWNK